MTAIIQMKPFYVLYVNHVLVDYYSIVYGISEEEVMSKLVYPHYLGMEKFKVLDCDSWDFSLMDEIPLQ